MMPDYIPCDHFGFLFVYVLLSGRFRTGGVESAGKTGGRTERSEQKLERNVEKSDFLSDDPAFDERGIQRNDDHLPGFCSWNGNDRPFGCSSGDRSVRIGIVQFIWADTGRISLG